MVNKSSTKVVSLEEGKREAEDDLEIQASKKQKKELIAPVHKEKTLPEAVKEIAPSKQPIDTDESSSSEYESSDEEPAPEKKQPAPLEKAKAESSSEYESSSDDEPAPEKKQPEPLKEAKAESSSEDDSSSDDKPAPEKKLPEPLKEAKAESSSEDDSSSDGELAPEDDSSSDEETAPVVKKQPEVLKNVKAESSLEEDGSSSDEEPTPAKKQPAVVKEAKAESGSSEYESSSDEETAPLQPAAPKNAEADKSSSEYESSSDEEPTPAKKQPTVVENVKPDEKDSSSSEEDSDDEESDDEEPPTKKTKVSVTKTSKQESSSDESDKEESEDEKVTPKKKDSDIGMVEAEQPKTPTTQTQGGSKTLVVRNLSYKVERSDVENFFKEVVDVRLSSDENGRFKGFGNVEFATAEAAQKALELNGTSFLGREVKLVLVREKSAPRSSNARNYQSDERGVGSQSKTIFVKGFDTSVGEDEIKSDLRAHFGACGEVARIVLPTDRESGVIKGIAFIDLKDGYDKALELRGSEIRGRKIDVREGKPRGSNGDGFSYNKRGRGRDQGRGPRGRGPR